MIGLRLSIRYNDIMYLSLVCETIRGTTVWWHYWLGVQVSEIRVSKYPRYEDESRAADNAAADLDNFFLPKFNVTSIPLPLLIKIVRKPKRLGQCVEILVRCRLWWPRWLERMHHPHHVPDIAFKCQPVVKVKKLIIAKCLLLERGPLWLSAKMLSLGLAGIVDLNRWPPSIKLVKYSVLAEPVPSLAKVT